MLTPLEILEVKEFLLKLAKERLHEARALGRTGAVEDGNLLLDEAKKLQDAFDLIPYPKS